MKISEIFELTNPLSEADGTEFLNDLRKGRDYDFPDTFLQLYRERNGFELSDNELEFFIQLPEPVGMNESICFHGFYPLDIIKDRTELGEELFLPKDTIPFLDVEEAEVVISLRADCYGAIFFCDRNPYDEQLKGDTIEEDVDAFNPAEISQPSIFMKLADSLDEFIELTKYRNWDTLEVKGG